MQLDSLSLARIDIAFQMPFKHSSATRTHTESVLVTARSVSGLSGYGEGCPRAYVSGENLASVQAFFARWRSDLLSSITDLASLRAWVGAQREAIDAQPAAWCAIELALLDLLAREQHTSVEQLLGLPPLAGVFQYSAVLGDGSDERFQRQSAQYLALGFQDFKLKLSGLAEQDRQRLVALQAAGARIRVDANNLWPDLESALAYFRQLDLPLFAIEEPLSPARRFADLARLSDLTGCPVIADESCLSLQDLEALNPSASFIVNLRVSKMGGLLRSLELAQAAQARAIPLIIGAQVGETSLLTRAALTVAQACADKQLLAQEGAFGTHLLKADLVPNPLMFGKAGRLKADGFSAQAGFGLDIDSHSIYLVRL